MVRQREQRDRRRGWPQPVKGRAKEHFRAFGVMRRIWPWGQGQSGRRGKKRFSWNFSDTREQGFDQTVETNDLRMVIQNHTGC